MWLRSIWVHHGIGKRISVRLWSTKRQMQKQATLHRTSRVAPFSKDHWAIPRSTYMAGSHPQLINPFLIGNGRQPINTRCMWLVLPVYLLRAIQVSDITQVGISYHFPCMDAVRYILQRPWKTESGCLHRGTGFRTCLLHEWNDYKLVSCNDKLPWK